MMNKPNLEQLLSQLKLVEPSMDLDDRVTKSIATATMGHHQQSHERLWARPSAFTAIIAATLLIGSATGYMIREIAPAARGDNNAPFVRHPSAENNSVASEQRVSHAALTSQFKGPAISITCSLASLPKSSDRREAECQDCHAVQNNTEQRFREEHMALNQFATCTLCHAADVSL